MRQQFDEERRKYGSLKIDNPLEKFQSEISVNCSPLKKF